MRIHIVCFFDNLNNYHFRRYLNETRKKKNNYYFSRIFPNTKSKFSNYGITEYSFGTRKNRDNGVSIFAKPKMNNKNKKKKERKEKEEGTRKFQRENINVEKYGGRPY